MPTSRAQEQTLYSHRDLAGCVLTHKNRIFGTSVRVCDGCSEQMSYQVITHVNTERSKK